MGVDSNREPLIRPTRALIRGALSLANLRGQQILDGITLFLQFFLSRLHLRTGEIIDFHALHNFPIAVFAHTGERVDQALVNAIAAIAVYTHADPIAFS